MLRDVYAILLAGGKGTRLWPLSTEYYSKPFIRLRKRKLLLEEAIERLYGIVDKKNILIVVDRTKARLLRELAKEIPKKNILVEPFGRNTASAVGLAAIRLKPESLMLIFPADQLVKKLGNFKETVKQGLDFITEHDDVLLCVGTVPTHASESFGHIKVDGIVRNNVFSVDMFIEKPSLDEAQKLLKNPSYLWNTGIFIFKAKTILNAIKKYSPILYKNLQRIKKDRRNIKSAYLKMKNISIDYQIMEKAKNLYCVKGKFIWQDIGNWASLEKLFKRDYKGNICIGKVCLIDVSNSIFYNARKQPIGAVGLKDAVVVNTDNGMLVCSKNDVERVKELVRKMVKVA